MKIFTNLLILFDMRVCYKITILVLLLQNIIFSSNVFSETELVINEKSYYEDNFSVFVLPEEKISISVGKIDGIFLKKKDAVCSWSIPREYIIEESDNLDIRLVAPKNKGVYQIKLKINYKDKEFLKRISIIVLISLENNKKLNSYFLSVIDSIEKIHQKIEDKSSDKIQVTNKIEGNFTGGRFRSSISAGIKYYATGLNLFIPKSVWNNQYAYENIPRGIIEVTKENENTFISEHFRLKDFVCKGDITYPKLICLNYNLIRKLEVLIDELKLKGHKVNNIVIMSGFRTPWYNKKINVTKFSRHIYGDAVDIYIDNDKNKRMDDLNKDKKVNFKDAKYLASIINEMDLKGIYPGGLCAYAGKKYGTPFVHIDTRGYVIRW